MRTMMQCPHDVIGLIPTDRVLTPDTLVEGLWTSHADMKWKAREKGLSAAYPLPMAVPLWKPATTATVRTIRVQLTAGM